MQREISPKVSVVMSVYNTERFVGEAVESVLRQTYGNIELVCFNDASTDGSLELLNKYAAKDSRMTVIDSKVNIRQGGGRNRAIRATSGNFIMFLDSDDLLVEDAVEKCVEAALANDSQTVFFDYCRFTTADDNVTFVEQLGADAGELTGDELRQRVLQRTASHVTAMYARTIIVDNGLFFPEGLFYEDNAVTLVMQIVGRNPVKINEVLYKYRFDNASVTRSVNNFMFFDRIRTAEILLGHFKRLGLYDKFKDLIDFQFINLYFVHTVFGAIYRFDKVQKDRIKEVREGIAKHLPEYRQNPYFKAQTLGWKLKLFSHTKWPGLIKLLSTLNRRMRKR